MLAPALVLFRGKYKPPGVPRINWDHPLAQGLLFYGYDAGGLHLDLAGGRKALSQGTRPGVVMGPEGAGAFWNDNGGSGTGPLAYFNTDTAIRNATAAGNYTWACAFRKTGNVGQYTRPFCRTAENAGTNPYLNWSFEINTAGAGQNDIVVQLNGTSNGFLNINHWTGWADNQFVTVSASCMFTAPSNLQGKMYGNGVLTGLTGWADTPGNDTNNDSIVFAGANASTTSGAFVGYVYYGAFWSRVLSDEEHALLHADPYCFLIYPDDELRTGYVGASANAYTLTAAQGSFAFTGIADRLLFGRRVGAAAGSLAFGGNAAGLLFGRKVAAGQGSLPFSGQATNLLFGRRAAAGQGAFGFAGISANLRAARQIAPAVGAFGFAGQSANFNKGILLSAGQASFGLSGSDAGLRTARLLSSGTANVPFAGQAASFNKGRYLSGAQGTFGLTGQAVGLLVARKIGLAAGAFGFTGEAITFVKGRRLTASGGAFSFSGIAANYRVSRKLPIAPASFSYAGQIARIAFGRRLGAAIASFGLGGASVGLRWDHLLGVGAAAFPFVGNPAILGLAGRPSIAMVTVAVRSGRASVVPVAAHASVALFAIPVSSAF